MYESKWNGQLQFLTRFAITGILTGVLTACGDSSESSQPLDNPVLATISTSHDQIREDSTDNVAILVSLDRGPDTEVQVTLSASGAAVSGADYLLERQSVIFPSGQTSASISLQPVRDWLLEGDEGAEIRISQVRGNIRIAEPSSTTVRIVDANNNEVTPAKAVKRPELRTFSNMQPRADGIAVRYIVANYGAAPSPATTVSLSFHTSPLRDVGGTTWAVNNVPPLNSGFSTGWLEEILPNSAYAPGDIYYGIVHAQPVGNESLAYDNSSYWGFRTDSEGHAIVSCEPPFRTATSGDDPLFAHQWTIRNTGQSAFASRGGVAGADLHMENTLTNGPTGNGVRVAIVDTGLEICHPDLADNVEEGKSYNFATTRDSSRPWYRANPRDPFNPESTGDHGTSIAGIIAAVDENGIGVRGVAPNVLLRGYNFLSAQSGAPASYFGSLGGSSPAPEANNVDVYNMSWSFTPAQFNASPDEWSLFRAGTESLRAGHGALYIKAAGNAFDDCLSTKHLANEEIGCAGSNGDALNNLPYLIVVGAFNASDMRSSYSSVGSNLWISAPSGQWGITNPATVTTDQAGREIGYETLLDWGLAKEPESNPDGDYVSTFNGTSAAAPHVTGSVAVLLEANPMFTWRDIRHILAKTARRIDPDRQASEIMINRTLYRLQLPWVENSAGYAFHNWYGFGAVSLDEAISFAENHVPGSLGTFRDTGWLDQGPGGNVPDYNGTGVELKTSVSGISNTANIEQVMLRISISHRSQTDLGIHLVSPSGTESVLNPVFNTFLARNDRITDWVLLSNAFYGERANGTWTLRVVDVEKEGLGRVENWRLRLFYGTHP